MLLFVVGWFAAELRSGAAVEEFFCELSEGSAGGWQVAAGSAVLWMFCSVGTSQAPF